MRGATAAIVAAALLGQSGCSLLAEKPTTASVLMDVGWAWTAVSAVPLVRCEMTGGDGGEDGCLPEASLIVIRGGPVLALFAILAATQLGGDTPKAGPEIGALPATPSDAQTLSLARSARADARAGRCEAARATLELIAARDADYHIALLAGGVLHACP